MAYSSYCILVWPSAGVDHDGSLVQHPWNGTFSFTDSQSLHLAKIGRTVRAIYKLKHREGAGEEDSVSHIAEPNLKPS